MAVRRRKRRRIRRVSRAILQMMLMICMCISTVVGVAIFFKVETITVEGNSHYTADEIIGATEIQLGSNLFTIPRGEISEKITFSLPYVQSISIKLSLPTGLRLVVEEQKGMVKLVTDTSSWYMGVQGKLLEEIYTLPGPVELPPTEEVAPEDSTSDFVESLAANDDGHSITPLSSTTSAPDSPEPTSEMNSLLDQLPLDWLDNSSPDYVLDFDPEDPVITVTGLKLVDPVAGQQVEVISENTKQLDALLQLFKELESHNLFQEVTSIHLHVFQYFEFYFEDRFLVKFPIDGNYSYKLRALIAAASETERYETGIMDLTQEHYAVLFTPD